MKYPADMKYCLRNMKYALRIIIMHCALCIVNSKVHCALDEIFLKIVFHNHLAQTCRKEVFYENND